MASETVVVVDTSCWIEALRRHGDEAIRARVIELVDDGVARFTDIVLLELWNGLTRQDSLRFLGELETIVETLPTTAEVWSHARRLARQARSRGVTAQPSDLLVFAAAVVHGAELFHRDAHFARLAELDHPARP